MDLDGWWRDVFARWDLRECFKGAGSPLDAANCVGVSAAAGAFEPGVNFHRADRMGESAEGEEWQETTPAWGIGGLHAVGGKVVAVGDTECLAHGGRQLQDLFGQDG